MSSSSSLYCQTGEVDPLGRIGFLDPTPFRVNGLGVREKDQTPRFLRKEPKGLHSIEPAAHPAVPLRGNAHRRASIPGSTYRDTWFTESITRTANPRVSEGGKSASGDSASGDSTCLAQLHYRTGLPAKDVDASLRTAVDRMQNAEGAVLLWFGEMKRRKLYKNLGFPSMKTYAIEVLGLSENMTHRFLRLTDLLEDLPETRDAIAWGELGWTHARELVKVASRETETFWIERAKATSRRTLERDVAEAKRLSKVNKRKPMGQADLTALCTPATSGRTTDPAPGARGGRQTHADGGAAGDDPGGSTTDFEGGATSDSSGGATKDASGGATTDADGGAAMDADSGVAKRTATNGQQGGAHHPLQDGGPVEGSSSTFGLVVPCETAGEAKRPMAADAPVTMPFLLTPLELAEYEGLVEALHKTGVIPSHAARGTILLMGLRALLESAKQVQASERETGGSIEGDHPSGTPRDHARTVVHPAPCGEAPEASTGSAGTRPGAIPKAGTGGAGMQTSAVSPEADVSTSKKGVQGSHQGSTGAEFLPRGKSGSHYRIVIFMCDTCGQAVVETNRGPKHLSRSELEKVMCDATIEDVNGHARQTIPPSIRRKVLKRDRYRCQMPGCTNTRFLEIHHRRARSKGGSDQPENLITLCSGCHQQVHQHGWDVNLLRKPNRD